MSALSVSRDWARVRPWLEPALEEGWTEDEVLNELLTCRAQLWLAKRGAVVTRIFNGEQMHIWLAGGRLSDVMSLLPIGLAWARVWGLKRLTTNARKGWARVLMQHGFELRDDGVLERAI